MKRLANYQPKPSTAPPPRAKAARAAEEAAVLVTATSPPHRSLLLHAIHDRKEARRKSQTRVGR